jgi:hypothetical protein
MTSYRSLSQIQPAAAGSPSPTASLVGVDPSIPGADGSHNFLYTPNQVLSQIFSPVAIGDVNYALNSTDRFVYTSAAFTTPHTWTIPAPFTVSAGQVITISDVQGTVTQTNTLTLACGTGSMDGVTSILLSRAYCSISLESDGASRWKIVSIPDGNVLPWTPTDQSGAGLVFTSVAAFYQVIGGLVFAWGVLTFPSTGSTTTVIISLPIPAPNKSYVRLPSGAYLSTGVDAGFAAPIPGTSTFTLYQADAGTGHSNTHFSTLTFNFSIFYPIA